MKKYYVSSGYIDRLIKKIEIGCFSNPTGTLSGVELLKLCLKPKNLYALHLLEASGEIRMSKTNNSEIPNAVWLENKGMLHSYTKWEKFKSGFWGFVIGVFSTTIVPYAFQWFLNRPFL